MNNETGESSSQSLQGWFRSDKLGDIWAQLRFMGFKQPLVEDTEQAINEFQKNHDKTLSRLKDQEVTLFRASGLPSITARYRESIPNSESIGTFEICLEERGVVSPVYHVRLMELSVNQKPTLVITAIQRYTDEHLTTVGKPHLYKGKNGTIQGIPSLEDKNPQRYSQYREETRLINKIERALNLEFPEICFLTVLAFAKANGNRQIMLTPYARQLSVCRNKEFEKLQATFNKPVDKIRITNIYDPLAERFGLKKDPDFEDWWVLKGNPDDISLTLPESIYQKLNPVLRGIAQNAFSRFSEILPYEQGQGAQDESLYQGRKQMKKPKK